MFKAVKSIVFHQIEHSVNSLELLFSALIYSFILKLKEIFHLSQKLRINILMLIIIRFLKLLVFEPYILDPVLFYLIFSLLQTLDPTLFVDDLFVLIFEAIVIK